MEKEVCVPSSGSDGLALVAAGDSPEYLGRAELRALGDFEGVELHDHVRATSLKLMLMQKPVSGFRWGETAVGKNCQKLSGRLLFSFYCSAYFV